jgi:hypothetical protein
VEFALHKTTASTEHEKTLTRKKRRQTTEHCGKQQQQQEKQEGKPKHTVLHNGDVPSPGACIRLILFLSTKQYHDITRTTTQHNKNKNKNKNRAAWSVVYPALS